MCEANEQQQAVQLPENIVCHEDADKERDTDHLQELTIHGLSVDHNARNAKCDAQHQAYVGDV